MRGSVGAAAEGSEARPEKDTSEACVCAEGARELLAVGEGLLAVGELLPSRGELRIKTFPLQLYV
jgi:hypothetical protein